MLEQMLKDPKKRNRVKEAEAELIKEVQQKAKATPKVTTKPNLENNSREQTYVCNSYCFSS